MKRLVLFIIDAIYLIYHSLTRKILYFPLKALVNCLFCYLLFFYLTTSLSDFGKGSDIAELFVLILVVFNKYGFDGTKEK